MSNNNDLVSVIIPTFNRAYCLPRTIDSVLRQSHHNVEVMIVDDGSTDETERLIHDRYGIEKRVRYIRQSNQGVSAARNTGIENSTGAYIAFLDSDDLWKSWKLELQLACLDRFSQAGMIWTDMEAVDSDGTVTDARYLRKMYSAWRWFDLNELFTDSCSLSSLSDSLPHQIAGKKLYAGDIFSPMIMGNMVHTSTVLIKRDRLEQVKGFNRDLLYSGEDYDFHLRTCRGGMVAFADVPSIQYRVGMSDQLTRPEMSVHMARNFLNTILPIIEHERELIRLPDRMIHLVLAEAYAWLGEKQLDSGDNRSAARHLFLSLRHQPWQPRIGALALISLMPRYASEMFRNFYRRLKSFS